MKGDKYIGQKKKGIIDYNDLNVLHVMFGFSVAFNSHTLSQSHNYIPSNSDNTEAKLGTSLIHQEIL